MALKKVESELTAHSRALGTKSRGLLEALLPFWWCEQAITSVWKTQSLPSSVTSEDVDRMIDLARRGYQSDPMKYYGLYVILLALVGCCATCLHGYNVTENQEVSSDS